MQQKPDAGKRSSTPCRRAVYTAGFHGTRAWKLSRPCCASSPCRPRHPHRRCRRRRRRKLIRVKPWPGFSLAIRHNGSKRARMESTILPPFPLCGVSPTNISISNIVDLIDLDNRLNIFCASLRLLYGFFKSHFVTQNTISVLTWWCNIIIERIISF